MYLPEHDVSSRIPTLRERQEAQLVPNFIPSLTSLQKYQLQFLI